MECARCGNAMEEGFVPDATYGAVVQSAWHPGSPERKNFLGIKNTVKSDRNLLHPISAYRCPDCGLLEFYAHAP